jgi:hypothetical protein
MLSVSTRSGCRQCCVDNVSRARERELSNASPRGQQQHVYELKVDTQWRLERGEKLIHRGTRARAQFITSVSRAPKRLLRGVDARIYRQYGHQKSKAGLLKLIKDRVAVLFDTPCHRPIAGRCTYRSGPSFSSAFVTPQLHPCLHSLTLPPLTPLLPPVGPQPEPGANPNRVMSG